MPSKEVASRSKICIVPVCRAVSADDPDRIFFAVPEGKRKEWLGIVGGDIATIKPNKRLFCCENHFDVKKDIEGYDFYKHFGGRIKLIENAHPSKNLGGNTFIKKLDDEPCDELVDPLSFDDDRIEDDENGDVSNSDINDNKSDSSLSNWNVGEIKLESSKEDPIEEIVVTSDVYLSSNEHEIDMDDVPLNVQTRVELKANTKDNSNRNSFLKVKREFIHDDGDDIRTSPKNFEYNCLKCNKILSSSRSLNRHVKSFHLDNDRDDGHELSCKECHENFVSSNDLKKHELSHKLLEFRCQKCGKQLSSSRSLKRHIQSFHTGEEREPAGQMEVKCELKADDEGSDREISCNECNDTFSNRDDYLRHRIIHKKTFECDVCSKVFRTRLHLKVHFPTHMKIKPFLCEICSRPFARANNFRRHRLTHATLTDKKYVCDVCGRRFPANYLLRQHKLHHHNESNRHRKKKEAICDCNDCGITLNSPYRLKLHRLKLHNPENPFQCDVCRQTFTTETLMNQHAMRIHSPEDEYIYKCYICPKKYNLEAALKRHVKLHTDPKKPVMCQLCSKVLGRPNRLKPHMRALHNPNNPFKCAICQQTFREQKILNNHTTQVHEQTILCQYCNKSYSNQRGLQHHIRKFHTDSKCDQNE